MILFITILFALTYIGMALGRVPGSRVDRTGIAMIVAVVLVAAGAVPGGEVAAAIHFPTLLLLAGLMILSARVGAAGFYDAAAAWIARQAGQPLRLLALTIAIGGVLSAFLVNDIVVFAMTPLLCAGLAARRLDARPFLFGLAAASNAGSAATLIGNPQNIMIGQVGNLGFWSYFAAAIVPSVIGLVISFACIAWIWRGSLREEAAAAPIAAPQFDRRATGICGLALLALLVLFTTPLPREISALLIAACLIVSRKFVTRQLLDEIDLPLLILFAGLFVVNDAFARTGLAEQAMHSLEGAGLLPDRVLVAVAARAGAQQHHRQRAGGGHDPEGLARHPRRDDGRPRHPLDPRRQPVPGRQPRQPDRGGTRGGAGRAAVVPRSRQGRRADHPAVDAGRRPLAMGRRVHEPVTPPSRARPAASPLRSRHSWRRPPRTWRRARCSSR